MYFSATLKPRVPVILLQGYSKLPHAAKMRLPEQPYNFVERVTHWAPLKPASSLLQAHATILV